MGLKILKRIAPFSVSACLVFLFFYPVLFSDETFFFRDIHRWFYPAKHFLAQMFQNGSIPYWCPNYFCGSPFISDLQSGVFYPLSLIFAVLPFHWSFNVYVCLHFFLGFLFFYGFIRSLGLSSRTAILTGISFCYGGFVIASVNTLNNLSAAIWLPAALWAFREGRIRSNVAAYGWAVIALTLCLLGGEPQLFMMTVFLLGFFALTYAAIEDRFDWAFSIKGLFIAVFLVLGATLIGMAQLGPAFVDYTLSVRAEGFSVEESARFSLEPAMLKHLLLPLRFPAQFEADAEFLTLFFPGSGTMPWLLSLYPGMLILPFAFYSLLTKFREKAMLWLLVSTVGIGLALGEHAPFYRFYYSLFPSFRFPEKFIFLTSFSLLLMAAYGLEDLFSRLEKRRQKATLLFLGLFAFLLLDLFWAHRHLNPVQKYGLYQKFNSHLQAILDDSSHFRVYIDSEKLSLQDLNAPSIRDYHEGWQMLLMPNLGILHGLSHVDGTSGLELRYQYLITEMLNRPWSEKIRFLRLANVKYIISRQNLDEVTDLAAQIERVNPLVFKIKEPLPRAWIVGKLTPVKRGSVEELLEPSFDPSCLAIVGGKIPEFPQTTFFREVESITYEKDSRIRIKVTLDQPGILVLSESSYPGWRVSVNGQSETCLWVNLLFQGVALSPGQNEVIFEYRPKHFPVFLTISLLSLCIVCSVFFPPFFLRKRSIDKNP